MENAKAKFVKTVPKPFRMGDWGIKVNKDIPNID